MDEATKIPTLQTNCLKCLHEGFLHCHHICAASPREVLASEAASQISLSNVFFLDAAAPDMPPVCSLLHNAETLESVATASFFRSPSFGLTYHSEQFIFADFGYITFLFSQNADRYSHRANYYWKRVQ